MGDDADSRLHAQRMHEAAAEAGAGARAGHGGPFGAVIFSDAGADGVLLGRGHNTVLRDGDPTAHAEVNALRDAAKTAAQAARAAAGGGGGRAAVGGGGWAAFGGVPPVRSWVVYTTCEPCPMCLHSCLRAGVRAIYVGSPRSLAADYGFDDSHFHDQLALAPDVRVVPEIDVAAATEAAAGGAAGNAAGGGGRAALPEAVRAAISAPQRFGADILVLHLPTGRVLAEVAEDGPPPPAAPPPAPLVLSDPAGFTALQTAARALGSHHLADCALFFRSRRPATVEIAAAWWARVTHILFNDAPGSVCAASSEKAACAQPPIVWCEHDCCRAVFDEWAKVNGVIY